jgi:serine/threonine protein kinase
LVNVLGFRRAYTSGCGGCLDYLSLEVIGGLYSTADDIWSLGIILGNLAGSLQGCQTRAAFTRYGCDHYHDLIQELKLFPELNEIITGASYSEIDPIKTILGRRKLSILAVSKHREMFEEISMRCLSFNSRERASSDILDLLLEISVQGGKLVVAFLLRVLSQLFINQQKIFLSRKRLFLAMESFFRFTPATRTYQNAISKMILLLSTLPIICNNLTSAVSIIQLVDSPCKIVILMIAKQ